MNQKQFEIWKKQKTREYQSELEHLQKDFTNRGLWFSGMRNKAEDELRRKYESEIEIAKLSIKDSNHGHVTVKMTESAKNNVFINSQIHGGIEIGGQGNSFINTKISTLREKHPFWFWFGIVGTFIGIITGLMYLAQYFDYLPTSFDIYTPSTYIDKTTATSTISLSSILSKALTLDTIIERQDFLTKYIGDKTSGQGTIKDISRFGDILLIDIDFYPVDVNCNQEASEDNVKKWLLAKGRRIEFVGKFPFSNTPEHGLNIDECILTFLE